MSAHLLTIKCYHYVPGSCTTISEDCSNQPVGTTRTQLLGVRRKFGLGIPRVVKLAVEEEGTQQYQLQLKVGGKSLAMRPSRGTATPTFQTRNEQQKQPADACGERNKQGKKKCWAASLRGKNFRVHVLPSRDAQLSGSQYLFKAQNTATVPKTADGNHQVLALVQAKTQNRLGKQTLLLSVPLSLSSCSDCSGSLHLPIRLFDFHHLPLSDIHLLPQPSPSVRQVSLKHSQLLRQSP